MLLKPGVNRYGSAEIAIVDVRLITSDGSAAEMTEGSTLSVEMDYVVSTPVESPIFCVTIVDHTGREVTSTSTEQAGLPIPSGGPGGHLTAHLRSIHLEPGTYFIDVGVYERNWMFAYDYHSRAYPIIVRQRKPTTGAEVASPPKTVWVHNVRESSGVGT
jgi:lipopolysaccharide transport system ATP-binding protein